MSHASSILQELQNTNVNKVYTNLIRKSMFFEGWGFAENVMIKTVKNAIIPDVVIVPS